jgi:hypothetical protein
MLRLVPVLCAVALLAASCGGGGDPNTGLDLASFTANDLAIAVLPAEQLAGTAQGLDIDPDQSGFSDNERAADDTIDPEDEAADLDELGRENGYTLSYFDDDFSSLQAKRGVFGVSTGIDLMEDAKSAEGFLEEQLADYERLAGTLVDTEVTLKTATVTPLAGPGEGAALLLASIEANGVVLRATIVAFRLDRLVAAVVLVRADSADVSTQAKTIAADLARRIRAVAAGTIAETPVPLPATGGTTTAPEGTASLAGLTLSLADLPAGVTVEREGYGEPDADVLARFSREFDLGTTKLGGSQLSSLEAEVELYEQESDATATLLGTEALLSGAGGKELFASGFTGEAGFSPENLELKVLDRARVGDASVFVFATFDTPGGGFDSLFVYVRVGRMLGTLYATATKGRLKVADVAALAEKMADRMASPIEA